MAKRSVYRVSENNKKYIEEIGVDFTWYPGFAVSQKQKSILDLHTEYNKIYKEDKVLEISSKSQLELGVKLSAFNLMITTKDNRTFSVESAFQSSKKFEFGGPYLDILEKSSREAKKDNRLKMSGKLIAFEFYGRQWPLEPKTIFYDWLYIRAVYKNKDLANQILEYDAFTDIEFNPDKSINCQARSAALFVSLSKRNLLEYSMKSIENYFNVIVNNNKENKVE
ncbi:DarT1-associated NADAR antitoxin family protein, partial [Clostridium butyricum]|uniref:DarT1-associated NADAR antitoxin family protein n=1 Tax=Clostridium butyricum TaxID=1492 RepID=UPI00374ED3BF